jgi:hypothetical protein
VTDGRNRFADVEKGLHKINCLGFYL